MSTDSRSASPRILLGFSHFPSRIDIRARVEAWIGRLRRAGFQVDPFVLTLNPPAARLTWRELDSRWRWRDRSLLTLYDNLANTLADYDVFINWNGINVHPDVLPAMPTYNVYACFDDPESSEDLSHPVAAAYDCCLVGNVACLDMYRRWGCRHVGWWPLGFHIDDYDPNLTVETIHSGDRDIDVTLLCERVSRWRTDRLDTFVEAFPSGQYYGRGWPAGFLPEDRRIPLLQRSKIGLNVHNSIGPVNYRTFYLPANGVMQLCDNRSHLGKIFEIGREVVGYETIDEAIDLCRYYLNHDEERREIAARGFQRAMKDYNEIAVFTRVVNHIQQEASSLARKARPRPVPTPSAGGSIACAIESRLRSFTDSLYAAVRQRGSRP